jgi:hypothetical protein
MHRGRGFFLPSRLPKCMQFIFDQGTSVCWCLTRGFGIIRLHPLNRILQNYLFWSSTSLCLLPQNPFDQRTSVPSALLTHAPLVLTPPTNGTDQGCWAEFVIVSLAAFLTKSIKVQNVSYKLALMHNEKFTGHLRVKIWISLSRNVLCICICT